MNNSSKKFLSCFLLALSLNRNACSMNTLVAFLGPSLTAMAVTALVLKNVLSNKIPERKLNSNNNSNNRKCCDWDLNDLKYGDGWYTRGEIENYYKEFIEKAMENDKDLTESGAKVNDFPYEGLGMLNKEKISNVAYVSNIGCKISFDNSDNIKLNLYPMVSKLFENDLSNLPANVSFNNSSIAFELLTSNLNKECREIFGEDFIPVKAENCRYDWKVSGESGIILERNGNKYATYEHFKTVKLTVYNDETNYDNKKIIPKKITAIFIVELKHKY